MDIIEITTLADLQALKNAWDNLVAKYPEPALGQTFSWIYNWYVCRQQTARPYILLVKDDHGIVAVAPFVRSQIRRHGIQMNAMGLVCDEFCPEFMIAPERSDESIRAMLDHLLAKIDAWDILQFTKIKADSLDTGILIQEIDRRGLWRAEDTNSSVPYIEITPDWDGYYNSLSSKFRQNIRRSFAKLGEKGKVSIARYSEPDEVKSALQVIFDIAKTSWQGQQGTDISAENADRVFYDGFAKNAAEQGWLDIRVLLLAELPIAFEYNIRYGDTVYAVKCGYDPKYTEYSPGVYLRRMTNEDYFKSGARKIDFMGFSQFWLSRWTETAKPHRDITVYQKKAKTCLPYMIDGMILPALKRHEGIRRFKKAVDSVLAKMRD